MFWPWLSSFSFFLSSSELVLRSRVVVAVDTAAVFASYWHRHTKMHCEEHSEHPEMVGETVKIFVVVRTEWASMCRLVRETRWVAKLLTVYLCSSVGVRVFVIFEYSFENTTYRSTRVQDRLLCCSSSSAVVSQRVKAY